MVHKIPAHNLMLLFRVLLGLTYVCGAVVMSSIFILGILLGVWGRRKTAESNLKLMGRTNMWRLSVRGNHFRAEGLVKAERDVNLIIFCVLVHTWRSKI